ncbi:CSC1-like protein HYP1 isoform X2 [Momordica charantia]|uniref:CSC1-like protein HYP1 isoform X2 n=1 Tax=Momordica charantia TaxID=3673 RepID=A0A6J1DAC0_MOMCH|nr:CSC1-like protein HYP1 isoform X2 [Momordica charantia]
MIVSALLTSVGINSALCLSFLVLYSILKKQPAYYGVYIPRLVAEGKTKQRDDFNLERLIPSPNWVKKAWMLSEEELLSSSGLDAVVFMRIVTFSFKVLLFAGVIGIFVLLPVNCSGDQLEDVDLVNISNNSLDVFTISNVKDGSHWLWIHFSAVYLITAYICCLLYYEYKYISSRRIEYFCSSKPLFHQFTILVRAIPASAGGSISDSVEHFFTEYHPSTYLSHTVVRRTSKLRGLINDAKTMYGRLGHLQSNLTQIQPNRGSCFGLFRRKDDLVDRYERRLGDIEQRLRLEQSEVSLAGKASFFIAYVVTSGWTSSLSELINLFPLIRSLVTKPFSGNSDDEQEVPSISYHSDIPRTLFFVLLGVTYFFLAPLILPFLLVHFSLEYIVYRNQFINVYAPKYETAGRFWPIAHSCIIFSLVLMHAIAVGIFTLKKLPLASSLLVPLPILTLLFNEYCRKRFLPNFSAYSAETLIKKDRKDENDPAMAEFLDNLVTAYSDPALMPVSFTANSDSLSRPLMSPED